MQNAIARFTRYLECRFPERSTSKHYSSDLKIFARFVGDKQPREIKVKTTQYRTNWVGINAFVEDQNRQQLKPNTINRRLASLSSFFQFLILEEDDDNVECARHSATGKTLSVGSDTIFSAGDTCRVTCRMML